MDVALPLKWGDNTELSLLTVSFSNSIRICFGAVDMYLPKRVHFGSATFHM